MIKPNKLNKKSTFEEAIKHYLDGDMRDNALEFAAWTKANGLEPRRDGKDTASWKIPYKDVCLCHIRFEPKHHFIFWLCDCSGEHDAGFTKAVQDHVQHCVTCNPHCPPGSDVTIFGKEYTNVCHELTVQFENPNAGELEYIKQLLEYWKTAGHTSESWHYRH